jgi:gamma-butyrobetaine dioxygenase
MTDLPDHFRERGYAVVPSIGRDPDQPWAFVHELVGIWPEMVERQLIRPIAAPKSFAGSARFTPFHTDSQDFLGAPPGLQIMVCRRAAAVGGETRLLDGWALLDRLERTDGALYESLVRTPRLHRFYFGDVTRPTVAETGGHFAWTHSPTPATDGIGIALAREIEREPVIELAVRAGEILLVDNHRMLHGRNAFSGTDRDFVRVLAWILQPLAEHPTHRGELGRSSLGRLSVVLEMLAGVAPSRLAAREGVSEAVLYEWRNRALSEAKAALDVADRELRAR